MGESAINVEGSGTPDREVQVWVFEATVFEKRYDMTWH